MNLGISKKLNYNLYSNAERAEQVCTLFDPQTEQLAKDHFDEDSTKTELEKIANFILYGKDPKNDKNFCQKKEIQIQPKYKAYQRKEPESLDALLEDPLTNETQFMEVKKNVYKKPKPTIDREKDASIPGIQDLWNAIDKLAAQVKELKEKGELGFDFYRKNHLLIQLRREQYVLKDSEQELIKSHSFISGSSPDLCFSSDTGYLRDAIQEWQYIKWRTEHYRKINGEEWYAREKQKLNEKRKNYFPEALSLNFIWNEIDNPGHIIHSAHNRIPGWSSFKWVEISENKVDLTNPSHVYQLLELYSSLKANSWENLNSDLKFLIWELEDYIEKANLSKARFHILVRKIDKVTNERIREELQEQFGLCYSDNYISTIYKQMICAKIAQAAQLSLDEFIYRNQPDKFKICSTCGKTLLRDPRNFIKKQNSKDGLSARCKDCDKKLRDEKKGEGRNSARI